MTIYNCVYKTVTSPKKIRELYQGIKDTAIKDNIIEKHLDGILEKYDNYIVFCNLKRTLNMLIASCVVGDDVTYDSIQKRIARKDRVYICSRFYLGEVTIVKIWK